MNITSIVYGTDENKRGAKQFLNLSSLHTTTVHLLTVQIFERLRERSESWTFWPCVHTMTIFLFTLVPVKVDRSGFWAVEWTVRAPFHTMSGQIPERSTSWTFRGVCSHLDRSNCPGPPLVACKLTVLCKRCWEPRLQRLNAQKSERSCSVNRGVRLFATIWRLSWVSGWLNRARRLNGWLGRMSVQDSRLNRSSRHTKIWTF